MPNKQIIQHDISLQLMLRKLTCSELNLHRERSTVTLISDEAKQVWTSSSENFNTWT